MRQVPFDERNESSVRGNNRVKSLETVVNCAIVHVDSHNPRCRGRDVADNDKTIRVPADLSNLKDIRGQRNILLAMIARDREYDEVFVIVLS